MAGRTFTLHVIRPPVCCFAIIMMLRSAKSELEAGVAFNEHGFEQGGMGVAVGDFDGDGLIDLFKTNFTGDYPNAYKNTGKGIFEDVVVKAGLAVNPQYVGWGIGLADLDNDGLPDLFQVNGHVYPELTPELESEISKPSLGV